MVTFGGRPGTVRYASNKAFKHGYTHLRVSTPGWTIAHTHPVLVATPSNANFSFPSFQFGFLNVTQRVSLVYPKAAPTLGYTKVRLRVLNFMAVPQAYLEVYFGKAAATVLSVRCRLGGRCDIIVSVPAQDLEGDFDCTVVPFGDVNSAAPFKFSYFTACDFEDYCGNILNGKVVNEKRLQRVPPSSTACSSQYCENEPPSPQVVYMYPVEGKQGCAQEENCPSVHCCHVIHPLCRLCRPLPICVLCAFWPYVPTSCASPMSAVGLVSSSSERWPAHQHICPAHPGLSPVCDSPWPH